MFATLTLKPEPPKAYGTAEKGKPVSQQQAERPEPGISPPQYRCPFLGQEAATPWGVPATVSEKDDPTLACRPSASVLTIGARVFSTVNIRVVVTPATEMDNQIASYDLAVETKDVDVYINEAKLCDPKNKRNYEFLLNDVRVFAKYVHCGGSTSRAAAPRCERWSEMET
ncbi:17029_t:CDS:2 [Acaulospora colombiana]|uniref:17029_t:CDS:1 n=1 Tax=Acaulospora colombiana TaxID=27376 RepID=A0ACA9KCW9_9GLOM|nr:17029_t:CDS:2 [Acaulospora colombiana]